MSLFVYIKQILWIYVSVALGGREARVTQKLLDRAEIASALQEMSGKRVPKRVCAGFCSYRSTNKSPGHDAPDGSVRKGPSIDASEDRIAARDPSPSL